MEWKYKEDRITYEDQGKVLAEVFFPEEGENRVNICHTFVDESLRGQGIAGQLLERAAKQLRSQGKQAVPTCSYAVLWFEKHPEYGDVLEKKN